MPTKIEEIYDAVIDLIEATLPTARRFPNPYQMEVNALGRTVKAFGVVVGHGVNTERYVGCLVSWQRTFTIRLLSKIVTTENNITKRETIEKNILVDHDALMRAFNQTTLGNKVIKATVSDDSGLDFLDGDRLKFLMCELTLTVEYQETLSGS